MKNYLFFALLTVFTSISTNSLSQNQWKSLFGPNLENADYDPTIWCQQDGVLSAVKDECIWTKIEYENFELDLEFKTDVETNSGIVVYCTDTKNWIPNSVEIQIADDYCEKWGTYDAFGRCGAIFGHLAPKRDRVVHRPGIWNRMRLSCIGKNIIVELNGEIVAEMDMNKWTSGSVNPDGTKIPEWLPKPFSTLPTKGKIGLQGKHGNALIWFRNIEIRTL